MKLMKGDMFAAAGRDLYLVTTNSTVRRDGALVMGRGAAAELARQHPEVPFIFGAIVREREQNLGGLPYGIMVDPHTRYGRHYGAFQVKYHWREEAVVGLIRMSTRLLKTLAEDYLRNWTIAVNFPGIGNGRLDRDFVLPIIEVLPDNVEVWER